MNIIADYFNGLKDENEEEISAQDVLANFSRGLFQLAPGLTDLVMRTPVEPVTVTKEMLEMLVVHSPKMFMDIWFGSGLNPIISGLALGGDERANNMIAEAQRNVAEYPFENLLNAIMVKGLFKAPQTLKGGIAKTTAYINEFIQKSDWYRKLTIKEKGLVKSMFQEISPETLNTLLERVKAGDKGAEAQLVAFSSEYKT